MGPNPPRVRQDRGTSNGDGALSSLGSTRSTRHSQSPISPWDWGFHVVQGGVDPRELAFRPPGVGVCRDSEGCLNRG